LLEEGQLAGLPITKSMAVESRYKVFAGIISGYGNIKKIRI